MVPFSIYNIIAIEHQTACRMFLTPGGHLTRLYGVFCRLRHGRAAGWSTFTFCRTSIKRRSTLRVREFKRSVLQSSKIWRPREINKPPNEKQSKKYMRCIGIAQSCCLAAIPRGGVIGAGLLHCLRTLSSHANVLTLSMNWWEYSI